ncbi:MAG: hypothetical protein WAW41_07465 [Methylobacter sp.]
MQDQGLIEFKSYAGNLKAGSDSAPITFQACIDKTGEVKFKFDAVTLTKETSFIINWWDGKGSNINYFSLSGKAEDGTEFKTEDLQFNSLSTEYNNETSSRMSPVGGCLQAEFRCKLAVPAPKPTLRMLLKGFQNFHQLSSECRLGKVVMDGEISINDPNAITGYIAVQSDNEPADLTAWHAEADKLLEHVRRVMSFASATMLHGPIIQFYAGDDLEMIALSQSRQASAPFRTFHYLNQQPIFDAAVKSFFSPPFKVKNLFFAIEWFAMESTHNEIRLVNAMTALENLVSSNLGGDDILIIPNKKFKETKRALREVLEQFIEEMEATTDDAKNAKAMLLGELKDSLLCCNRRSILKKLRILAEKEPWSVPLADIGDDKIQAAISARNRVVHRGHYYDDGKEESSDALWEHTLVVREIVVRFLLAAIGYRGKYISYVGGCHETQFPPPANICTGSQAPAWEPR